MSLLAAFDHWIIRTDRRIAQRRASKRRRADGAELTRMKAEGIIQSPRPQK